MQSSQPHEKAPAATAVQRPAWFAPQPPSLVDRRVAVLAGGTSSERDVSLQSGRNVLATLGAGEDGLGPGRVDWIEIRADGRWQLGTEAKAVPAALEWLADVDVVFIALHGGSGEDGTLQGLFDSLGQAYIGPGVFASAVAMDKFHSRTLARAAGLSVAKAWLFARHGDPKQLDTDRLKRICAAAPRGLAVKPRCGGSSVGMFRVSEAAELLSAIQAVLADGDDALVEAWIEGREVSCGLLGNQGMQPLCFTPIGIEPKQGHFFDYQQKYDSEAGAGEFCPPRGLDADCLRAIQAASIQAHQSLRCDGYSRSDFIVPSPGQSAQLASQIPSQLGEADPKCTEAIAQPEADPAPVFLELNTLPGLTQRSLLPQSAQEQGLGYRHLCLWILELARQRFSVADHHSQVGIPRPDPSAVRSS